MNEKFKIGHKGLIKTTGNLIRGNREPETYECEIKKIGRKYFTISFAYHSGFDKELQFNIDDLTQKTDYSPDYLFYFDEQHFKDTKEKEKLDKELKEHFNYYKKSELTLDQLRAIKKIIEGDN